MITNTLILKCKEQVCLRNSKISSIQVIGNKILTASKDGFVSILEIIEDTLRDKVNLTLIKMFNTKRSVRFFVKFY